MDPQCTCPSSKLFPHRSSKCVFKGKGPIMRNVLSVAGPQKQKSVTSLDLSSTDVSRVNIPSTANRPETVPKPIQEMDQAHTSRSDQSENDFVHIQHPRDSNAQMLELEQDHSIEGTLHENISISTFHSTAVDSDENIEKQLNPSLPLLTTAANQQETVDPLNQTIQSQEELIARIHILEQQQARYVAELTEMTKSNRRLLDKLTQQKMTEETQAAQIEHQVSLSKYITIINCTL